MIGFVTWPPFHTIIISKGGQVTKPIIVVKICYKLLYVIQVDNRILISNFLASTDIKVFGCTCLQCCMLLIGLVLFLHSGCFCLASNYTHGYIYKVSSYVCAMCTYLVVQICLLYHHLQADLELLDLPQDQVLQEYHCS